MDAEQIKRAIKVDLTTDERPLHILMKLWEDEGENISIEAFEKIEVASQSSIFKNLWNDEMQKETDQNHPPVSLSQLRGIYKASIDKFTKIYEALRSMSMQVNAVHQSFGSNTLDFIKNELQVMGESLADSTQTEWITDTYVHIKRYLTLRDVVKPASTVYALQEGLKLTGDFSPLSDFQVNVPW